MEEVSTKMEFMDHDQFESLKPLLNVYIEKPEDEQTKITLDIEINKIIEHAETKQKQVIQNQQQKQLD